MVPFSGGAGVSAGGGPEQRLGDLGVCHGEGRVRKEKVLGIKIPAGVEDGMRLRVNGEGDTGSRNGEPGDFEGAAAFLAGRASDYVTGQTLFVDGGFAVIGPYSAEVWPASLRTSAPRRAGVYACGR